MEWKPRPSPTPTPQELKRQNEAPEDVEIPAARPWRSSPDPAPKHPVRRPWCAGRERTPSLAAAVANVSLLEQPLVRSCFSGSCQFPAEKGWPGCAASSCPGRAAAGCATRKSQNPFLDRTPQNDATGGLSPVRHRLASPGEPDSDSPGPELAYPPLQQTMSRAVFAPVWGPPAGCARREVQEAFRGGSQPGMAKLDLRFRSSGSRSQLLRTGRARRS